MKILPRTPLGKEGVEPHGHAALQEVFKSAAVLGFVVRFNGQRTGVFFLWVGI